MIQGLIPILLMVVADQLKEEVVCLTGKRYTRQGSLPGHYQREFMPEGYVFSISMILRRLVIPGCPTGTPAVTTRRWPA